MKNVTLKLLAAGAVSVLMTSTALALDCPKDLPLVEAGKLTMSINATIPPVQYIDEQGNLVGLNRDLGDEIAKRLCLEPVYANVGFEVQIPGLASKRWDMINTGLYYTEERSKIMHLIPYRVNALALISKEGNPMGFTGPEDLAGHIVGVEIAGFEEKKLREINDEQVAKGLESMDIRVFNTYGDTFLALGAGQLDAVFAGDNTGAYYQKRGQFTIAATGLLPGTPSAFATQEAALAVAVVAALDEMMADGTYAKLMDDTGATKIDTWTEWKGQFQFYYKPDA